MEDYRSNEIQKRETDQEEHTRGSGANRFLVGGLIVAILMILGLGYGLYSLHTETNESFQDLNDQLAEMQETLPLFAERIDQHQTRLSSLDSDWEVFQDRVGVTEKELAQARTLAENLRKE